MILIRAVLCLALIVCMPFVLVLTAALCWHDAAVAENQRLREGR